MATSRNVCQTENIQSFAQGGDLSSHRLKAVKYHTTLGQVVAWAGSGVENFVGFQRRDTDSSATGEAVSVAVPGGGAMAMAAASVAPATNPYCKLDSSGRVTPCTDNGDRCVFIAEPTSAGAATTAGDEIAGRVVDMIFSLDLIAAGTEGNRSLKCAFAVHDFSVDGGAIGTVDSGVTIPAYATIVNASYKVLTGYADGASDLAKVAIGLTGDTGGSESLTAAATIATGTTFDKTDADVLCIPDIATVGDYVHIGATAKNIIFNIADVAITAGKMQVAVMYFEGTV